MVNTEVETKPMKEIEVLNEFPDIFHEDLTQLLPNRDVEFTIDLVPRVAPMSNAPYRMALMEMKELQV